MFSNLGNVRLVYATAHCKFSLPKISVLYSGSIPENADKNKKMLSIDTIYITFLKSKATDPKWRTEINKYCD